MQYYSQDSQDEYLDRQIFKGMTRGIFVDVGAYDGFEISNSLFFEKHRNWTGLCVEPNPAHRESLEKRKCHKEYVAVADHTGELDFFANTGRTCGLSGLVDHYHPAHKIRLESENETFGSKTSIIKVPVVPLQNLLDEHAIDYIHYLSIDTEGSEFSVLKSIDYGKTYIDVIGFEANYSDEAKKCVDFLNTKGYKVLKQGLDIFMIHRESCFA